MTHLQAFGAQDQAEAARRSGPDASAQQLHRHEARTRRLQRAWLALGLAGVLVLTLGYAAWHEQETGWQQQDKASAEKLVFAAERALYTDLHDTELVLQTMVDIHARSSAQGEARLRELGDWLQSQQGRLSGAMTLHIVDADGLLRYGPGLDPGTVISYADQAFFIQASQSRDPVVGPPLRARQGQNWVLPFARRLDTAQHGAGGVVFATLDLDKLGYLLPSEAGTPSATVFLLDADGNLQGRGPGANGADSANGEKPAAVEFRALWNQGQRAGTYSTQDSRDAPLQTVSFRAVGNSPLSIAVSETVPPALATARQWQHWALAALLALALLGWGGCAWLLQRWQRSRDAQYRLLQAQAWSGRLLEGVPGMLAYWDRELRPRFASAAYSQWFGQELFKHEDMNLRQWQGQAVFAQSEPYCRAALAGQAQHFERTLTRPDGSVSDTWTRYIPDLDPTGEVLGFIELTVDVTPLKHDKQQLELADSVYRNITEGILVTDAQGVIQSLNAAFSAITGYSPQELVGQPPLVLKSGRYERAHYDAIWQALREKGQWKGELWTVHKSGDEHLLRTTLAQISDASGQPGRIVAVFNDITDLWRKDEFIRHQAYYDALTDLPNRALLIERMDRVITAARRTPRRMAIMFMDLDGFKRVNDVMGHDAGDELLKVVAHRLEQLVRQSDTVARLGGDEFVLLIDNPHNQAEVVQVAERVLKDINAPIELRESTAHVGVSIGIAIFPKDGRSTRELLKCADAAMYQAKEAGKNNYHLF